MESHLESGLDFATARAMLEWQVDLGASEAIGDTPVNRYEATKEAQAMPLAQVAPAPAGAVAAVAEPREDPVAVAKAAAEGATSLTELRAALDAYEHCELKRGARNLVFADGNPESRVMIIGEAPGRDEDAEGLPFVGKAGQLLDRMFAAIGMGRQGPDPALSIYITNVMPWRPPQNREPTPDEIAMMLPFLQRHVELVAPDVIVVMGNTPCQALLGRKGITRMRGVWAQALGLPVLPMFHPAYLLRTPAAKREAWADLLALQARLRKPA